MTPTVARGADEIFLGFTRALRAAGVPVTQDRAHGFLAAVALVAVGALALERAATRSLAGACLPALAGAFGLGSRAGRSSSRRLAAWLTLRSLGTG